MFGVALVTVREYLLSMGQNFNRIVHREQICLCNPVTRPHGYKVRGIFSQLRALMPMLDVCSLQRPLDDRSQPRINIEAEAMLTIPRLAESGRLELLSSDVLEFEIDRIPNRYRKAQAIGMLKLADYVIELNVDFFYCELKIPRG